MATIKAFYRTSIKADNVNIRFRLSDGRNLQLFHKSEISISPDDFDTKNQTFKERKQNTATPRVRQEFNKSISERKDLILKLYNVVEIKETLTSEWLDDAIDRDLHPEKYIIKVDDANKQPDTVLTTIKHFIENADKRKDKKTGRLLSVNTKKQYVTTEKHIIEFAKYQHKNDYQFSEVNEKFYTDFVEYLTNKKYINKTVRGEVVNETKRYTQNSIGKYIRAFKVMIATAKSSEVDTSSFYVFNEDVDNVYLNETELQILKDFDFSTIPHLDRVRDWFLLLAWSGSRFSDLDKIGKSDIKNNTITYRQKKTNTSVTIPLHPVVNEILKKYNYNMPDAISNQKFNDYIKEVCRLAGLNGNETITRTVGGRLKSETMPKYELISSHTCRRSFCTNMYLRGVDTMIIRSISGHKTEKSFLKYIKVTQAEHAQMLDKKFKEFYK